MTLADLRTELQARGFDYLSSARCLTFLNAAYQLDISEAEDWPFLEATSTGVAPLAITDLRTIESVIDTTMQIKLIPLDRRNITDDLDTSLSTAGTPYYYYTTGGTTVAVYPANTTDALSVRYWKVPTALSADGDTPVLPSRFHSLIVDAAVSRAYEDNDEWQMAQAASGTFQARLELMRESLMSQQHDLPDDYVAEDALHTDASWAW